MSNKTNNLIFVVESDDPDQVWTGHVDKAFEEFFEAMNRHSALFEKAWRGDSDVKVEELPAEPGSFPDNVFNASNGLRIWWHNPHIPEEMRPRPSKTDLEKVLAEIRRDKDSSTAEEE